MPIPTFDDPTFHVALQHYAGRDPGHLSCRSIPMVLGMGRCGIYPCEACETEREEAVRLAPEAEAILRQLRQD